MTIMSQEEFYRLLQNPNSKINTEKKTDLSVWKPPVNSPELKVIKEMLDYLNQAKSSKAWNKQEKRVVAEVIAIFSLKISENSIKGLEQIDQS